ncbi:hypothetical protein [Actinokineospora sp. UTMC 2448]|uniref:hypothetical protein n=1 Tax=Actinokineospora sp. UTMC 2448 TaxID=2268449 RepID=UPI0021644F8D|nr:hypothetical protein [Actinokineospora sp. UTMC 2448]UVS82386.1 hypothetical protein Actkin_06155 [Actinokineospora sp. UTMC 2448]
MEERIAALEREVASVRRIAEDARADAEAVRTLATSTDRDPAVTREQIERGHRLTRLEDKLDRHFHQVNEKFAAVHRRFDIVTAGIRHITALLTQHIEKTR